MVENWLGMYDNTVKCMARTGDTPGVKELLFQIAGSQAKLVLVGFFVWFCVLFF